MDYKTLYGIIFMPIIFALCYMGYSHIKTEKDKTLTTNTSQIMTENYEQLPVQEFRKILESGEATLIDVRTLNEQREYGIISKNQLHIEYGSENFTEEILKLDRSKQYLVYCWHGVRSAHTREFMKENGFSSVKDLKGGIDDWNKD